MANDLRFVETNPNLIFQFDNVLNSVDLKYINTFNWNTLGWTSAHSAGYRKTFNFKDTDQFPLLTTIKDKAFRCFQTIDPDVKINRILTFAFGLTENNGKMFRHLAHPDILEPGGHWTLLYHLAGESGPTDFYNNSINNCLIKSVEYKPGRLLIYPAVYHHQGSMPNNGMRLIVNIRAIINTKLNEDILKNSPNLQKEYQKYYINASDDNLLQPL
jgi:hypothetical protein